YKMHYCDTPDCDERKFFTVLKPSYSVNIQQDGWCFRPDIRIRQFPEHRMERCDADSSGNEDHPLPAICEKRADGTAHGHLHAGFELEEGLFIITRPIIYPGRHFNHVLLRGRRDCEMLCRRFDFLMANCEKSVLPRPPAQPLRLFKSQSIYIPCNLTPLFENQFFLFENSCCIF